MPLTVEIVTAERLVRSESDVDTLIVPGSEGQLAILPRHAALMTTLTHGEVVFRRGETEEQFAVAGGFVEVREDRVTILADQAEAAEEIDESRAEQARRKAEERIRAHREQAGNDVDLARAQAALRRALTRLRTVELRRRRPGPPRPGG